MLSDETLDNHPALDRFFLRASVSDLGVTERGVRITQFTPEEYLKAGGPMFFGGHTQLFFANPPWNEKFICLRCKHIDDFTGDGVYTADHIEFCSKHRTRLTEFWSLDRFRRYVSRYMHDLHPDQINGYIAWVDDVPVGWITGYPLTIEEASGLGIDSSNRTYNIDLLGTVPSVRRRRSKMRRLREILFIMKIRTSPVKMGIFDLLIKLTGLPIVGVLYLRLLRRVFNEGFRTIVTKTHVDAMSVRHLLEIGGFKEIGPDKKDSRLSYWRKDL